MEKNKKKPKKRELSQEKIVAAALEILAREDEAALTMRRIATLCDVSAMALYHHVDDKEQLAELAVDSIFLKAAETSRNRQGPWRECIYALYHDIREGLVSVFRARGGIARTGS